MSGFPVRRAHELHARPAEQRWLIEDLWSDQAVGIVGGQPKSCKSFLALDMAVSVASGAPCLRRFEVRRTGPVLLFAAEDALHVVRARLEGIAAAAAIDFEALDVHVITRPAIRLDVQTDRKLLTETIEHVKPILLVLDPFVRLHRVDENVAGDVAPLLDYLRRLQRQHALAVALVHHARKASAGGRDGQALRGSSELHAWGDSNLYLRRQKDDLILAVEHRASAAPKPMRVELIERAHALALETIAEPVPEIEPSSDPTSRIEDVLRSAPGPLSARAIRAACHLRMQTVVSALKKLVDAERVRQTNAGYELI